MGLHWFDNCPAAYFVFLFCLWFLSCVVVLKLAFLYGELMEKIKHPLGVYPAAPIEEFGDQPSRPMKPADRDYIFENGSRPKAHTEKELDRFVE